jgi:hypothetical protein
LSGEQQFAHGWLVTGGIAVAADEGKYFWVAGHWLNRGEGWLGNSTQFVKRGQASG